MTITHYISSKGELKEIATMPFTYLRNAANNLRKNCPPHRQPELAAMDAELAKRAIEYRAQLVQERQTADPTRVAEIDKILAEMDSGQ